MRLEKGIPISPICLHSLQAMKIRNFIGEAKSQKIVICEKCVEIKLISKLEYTLYNSVFERVFGLKMATMIKLES